MEQNLFFLFFTFLNILKMQGAFIYLFIHYFFYYLVALELGVSFSVKNHLDIMEYRWLGNTSPFLWCVFHFKHRLILIKIKNNELVDRTQVYYLPSGFRTPWSDITGGLNSKEICQLSVFPIFYKVTKLSLAFWKIWKWWAS